MLKWSDDRELIQSTIRHESVYMFVSDDTCPVPEAFELPELGEMVFAAECHCDGYKGCFLFIKKSDDEAEIHTCMLPSAKGMATDFGKMVLEKVFRETKFNEVSTFIPETNTLAANLAKKCGLTYRSEHEPITINGKIVKCYRYAINRGDLCPLH